MAELAEHRIAEIELAELVSSYPRLIGKNARLGSHGAGHTAPIALVRTDQGATGWGIVRGSAADIQTLIGRRLADLFDAEQGVVAGEAAALDFALHDLAGVILNQPVYRMLGAAGERSVPCYDGAIYMDDLDPEDAPRGIAVVLENCAHDYGLGYRAFKLKIGRGHRWSAADQGLRRDVEVTRAVRERYPDCAILVDANDGYTVDGLLGYLDGVADCRLFWIEEPFPERREDLQVLRRYLERKSPETLIADGEARPEVPQLVELAREGLIDVLLMDIVGYGLTPWRRLMPTLIDLGIRTSPHNWGDPLKTLYTAQVAAGLGNVITVEGVPGTAEAVDVTAYQLENGLLRVSDLPGWGIRPPEPPSDAL